MKPRLECQIRSRLRAALSRDRCLKRCLDRAQHRKFSSVENRVTKQVALVARRGATAGYACALMFLSFPHNSNPGNLIAPASRSTGCCTSCAGPPSAIVGSAALRGATRECSSAAGDTANRTREGSVSGLGDDAGRGKKAGAAGRWRRVYGCSPFAGSGPRIGTARDGHSRPGRSRRSPWNAAQRCLQGACCSRRPKRGR